jgi:hypothetical protein
MQTLQSAVIVTCHSSALPRTVKALAILPNPPWPAGFTRGHSPGEAHTLLTVA